MQASGPTVLTTTILDLPGTGYRLRKALLAEVEREQAGFVIYEQSTGVFYYDPDLSKVLQGFFEAFVDQFEFLLRNRDKLSPSLQAELERFESLIERQPVAV